MVRNVRLATPADLGEVLEVCEKHHASVPFGALPFSRRKVYGILSRALESDPKDSVLILSVDGSLVVGVLLANIAEVSFSEEKVANEIAFWLLPGYRKGRRVLDLIGSFEYWAEHIAKVNYVLLSKTPIEDTTERSYKALGYTNIETNYLKKLG